MSSPTVRGRRLARLLRTLRERSKLTGKDVADQLDMTASWLSKIESGHNIPQLRDLKALLRCYGVSEGTPLWEEILELRQRARQQGWWVAYEGVTSAAVQTLVDMENEASLIRTYAAELVPGLLQTEGYITDIMRFSVQPWTEEEVRQTVEFRADRQKILLDTSGPELWVVLDEAVLRRPVGGPGVMAEQLLHIADLADLPKVSIQVLPFSAGAHASMDGSFHLLRFGYQDTPEVAYIEHDREGWFLEKQAQLSRYDRIYGLVSAAALNPSSSVELLRETAAGYAHRCKKGT